MKRLTTRVLRKSSLVKGMSIFDIEESIDRLAAIEDILGDEYDLDELREMVQAKREGRCVVLPCKVGDTVYQLAYMTHSEAIKSGVPQRDDPLSKRKYGHKRATYLPLIVREKKMVKTLYREFGKTVFLTIEEAEAALRREQDEKGGESE